MKVIRLVLGLTIVAVLTNCGGGGGGSGPASLQIQLSPPSPTLAVNSSVLISAQTAPQLPAYFATMTWGVLGSPGCAEGVENAQSAPPLTPCPNGWLAWNLRPPPDVPTAVYYYAPAAPGTYQVNVQGQITNESGTVVNQGSASAAVTVNAE